MSKPRVENIENLWRNIEGPPPSIPFKVEENLNMADFVETDEGPIENPFEGKTYGPPGTEPYDDPFENAEDYGDYDAEVEIINLNKRVSREFSLSHYDVNIREFGRLRAKYANNNDDVNEYDDYDSRELMQNRDYDSGELSDSGERAVNHVHESHDYEGSNDGTGSGHLICDCEDCINQAEVVECQCENCVQSGEVIHHSPQTGEVTCDCDDCLNNSAESYSCECENCRTGEKGFNNNNKPHETCKCENCVEPDDDGNYSGENVGDYPGEVCVCEKCCAEDEITKHVHVNGANNEPVAPDRFRGLRGSPLGSSQQFDLPRIEEVDQLVEEEHSHEYANHADNEYANELDHEYVNELDSEYVNQVNHEYANTNNETEKFANELFTKLEKVKLNGSEEIANTNAPAISHKQKFLHDTVFTTKHTDSKEYESKNKLSKLTVSEILCSNPSLQSNSAVTHNSHSRHSAFRDNTKCDCRDCLGPEKGHNPQQGFRPPKGHNHVIQPLAVTISG